MMIVEGEQMIIDEVDMYRFLVYKKGNPFGIPWVL